MSILIKGMKMPKNCKECLLGRMDDIDFDYVLYCTANKKYADLDMYDHPIGWKCPIIEVPTPHGRLIDADALIADLVKYQNTLDPESRENARVLSVKSYLTLARGEAIIEAEEGE